MFMTQDHAEEPLGQPFGRDHFWRWVEFSNNDVWYYVSTSYARDSGDGFRYYFLTKPTDLVNLIAEANEEFWIERVMAVIPPHMNGSSCWEMHQLKKLIAISNENDIVNVDYIYQLEGDLVYGPLEVRKESTVVRSQVLFSERHHASPNDK